MGTIKRKRKIKSGRGGVKDRIGREETESLVLQKRPWPGFPMR